MSAVVASPRLVTAAPVRGVVPALAVKEARHLLRHPLMLAGFAIWISTAVDTIVSDGGPREAFEAVDSMLSFFPGIFTILAANLVATRDRRAGAREILAPVPARPGDRVLALVLASLVPALAGLVLVTSLFGYLWFDGRFEVVPSLWHVIQGPVTLAGGCLLGIMFAAWAPARGTAVIAMVGMVVLNAWLAGLEHGQLFGPLVTWPVWGLFADSWAGFHPGDPWGHIVYLVGLCGMAAAAALIRVADRRRPVVLFGLLSVATAVAGGLVQLP